jgi:hypothetical protein
MGSPPCTPRDVNLGIAQQAKFLHLAKEARQLEKQL